MSATLRRSALWLGLMLVTAALAPSPPGEAAGLSANAKARIALARESLTLLDEFLKVGKMNPVDPRYETWSRRLIEVYEDLPGAKAERVAAIKAHIERMRDQLNRAIQQHEMGRLTVLDVNEVRFRLLEAEAWLTKAESK
jgi:hypothetical protein